MERQARHDADRAGDLQHVDNPYAPGGAKFGFNFATGRGQVQKTATVETEKSSEGGAAVNPALRGKRGTGYKKPYVRRSNFGYHRYGQPSMQAQYQNDPSPTLTPTGPAQASRPYYPFKGENAVGSVQKSSGVEPQTM